MGMYVAFAYFEFRETGDLVLPVMGLPGRVHLLARPTLASALVVTLVLAALVGLAVFGLVFRPLRHAPALAQVVASLGLLLYFGEVVRLRFTASGSGLQQRRPILPDDPVHVFGTTVTQNRLLLAGLAIVATLGLDALFRFTRFGLATRAVAANEKGALLLGISPDRLGSACWALASMLGGMAVVLIEPISGINSTSTSLLVIPALAAALLGRLQSFWVATAAGLGVGMAQSLILNYSVRPDSTWIPSWLPTTGLQEAVPMVLIIAVLAWRGDALPDRAAIAGRHLPPSPTPQRVAMWAGLLSVVVAVALFTVGTTYRQALIASMIYGLLTLSIVVVTGYSGQISLASLAFAGIAGFSVIRLAENHVPFPVATLAAAALATAVGTVVAYPATRVRGMSLAIATLAMAVAIEQLVLASPPLSGGAAGSSAPPPSLFGLDLRIDAAGSDNFRPEFGILVLVGLVAGAVAVANLRRNRTGLRWLALRANERAAAAAGIDVTRAKLGAFAVSSFLSGVAGVMMAYGTSTLSPSSFMVIGSLVALALTYLAGVSSISGALVAAALAQGGIFITVLNSGTSGDGGRYVFLINGVLLIVAAIAAPQGLTGLWRERFGRRAEVPS